MRIFDPFSPRREDADGMGLSIAYGIVAGTAARFRVHSTPGVGTGWSSHSSVAGRRPLPAA